MALDFKRVADLFLKKRDESSLIRILVEYSRIKQNLESPDNQSWYFKKGIESSKQKVLSLKKEYEELRKFYNESSVDYFIEEINEGNRAKAHYEQHGMNTIQQWHYSSIVGNNELFNELIRLKSKTKLLMPIDLYLERPDEFLKLID